jgi:polyisoprenyl-phosphate glycosyltransferase
MISVVIPAFNECAAIRQCVAEVRLHLNSSGLPDAQIIVVDDCSTDGTGDEARAAGAKVLRNCENLGYGASIKIGLLSALHDTVAIMDADLTYPPDQIGILLAEYSKGSDMVVARRTGPYFRDLSFPRFVLRLLINLVTGHSIPDINSGMRIFDRRDSYPLFDYLCNSFSFTTSLTLTYIMTGKRIEYCSIVYRKRCGQRKARLVRDSTVTLYYILICAIRFNSLKSVWSSVKNRIRR